MVTTPDSLGGNAEDVSLYSFYWWLMKPKLLTVHPLKCSHGSFAMCCWFTVRADDLPKTTQCVCVCGRGGGDTLNSETCLCSDLEVESVIYLSRCCQEKKRTLSPRTRNHMPLSHTVLCFQKCQGQKNSTNESPL